MMQPTRSPGLLLVIAAIAVLVACGGGDRAEPRPPVDPGGDAGGGDTVDGGGDAGTGGGGEPGTGGETGGEAGTGGTTPPVTGGVSPPAATPGATVFARLLGGAGVEDAVGPLAFDADGGFVALSKFGAGDGAPSLMNLGIARFDAAGATRWSKSFKSDAHWLVSLDVAISPLGNVFLGFTNYSKSRPDFGGGPVPLNQGVVVKLAPDGGFVWQRTFHTFEALAVDVSGSALVATPFELVKLRWDGVELWRLPDTGDLKRVAFDPAGNVLVGSRHADGWGVIRKLDPDGNVLWSHAINATDIFEDIFVEEVETTTKGTVVVSGSFLGTFRFGEADLVSPEGDLAGFVVVLEADGRERWGRARPRGPVAVDPAGRLALLDVAHAPSDGCADELAKWDLTGKELWRRPVASCDGAPGLGAVARGVGVAPSGAIWIQGTAYRPFDLGTGVLTPRGESDWWLLRVAP